MSEKIKWPSEKELAELPRPSMAVYALRCALRVQPFWISWNNMSSKFKAYLCKFNSAYKFLLNDASDATAAATVVAIKAASDADADSRATGKGAIGITAFRALAAAVDAASIADVTNIADDDASYYAAAAADNTASVTSHNGIAAARADYSRLLELKTEVTDASETGPLGDLWQSSPPDWYIEAKEKYDKTIAKWERDENTRGEIVFVPRVASVLETGGSREIEQVKYEVTIQVPVGEDDETAINNAKKLVTYIDELHKSKGGGGVTIDLLKIFESENALVPTSPEGM